MKKENMRIVVSKRMMKEGLLRCLATTPLDQITITALCREAQVNRATFYHHYQTPRDVLVDIGWDHAMEIQRIFGQDAGLPVRERMTACFAYLYEHKKTASVLFAAGADEQLAEAVSEIFIYAWSQIIDIKSRLNLADEAEYRLAITSYGWAAYHLIRQWLLEDIAKTPDEITELFIKLSGGGLFA